MYTVAMAQEQAGGRVLDLCNGDNDAPEWDPPRLARSGDVLGRSKVNAISVLDGSCLEGVVASLCFALFARACRFPQCHTRTQHTHTCI